MRVRKFRLTLVLVGAVFFGLAACAGSDWRSPGLMHGRPLGAVVTPRAPAGPDLAAAAPGGPARALAAPAAQALATPAAQAQGVAGLDAVLAATENFCTRQGGLAAMTREGCLASLDRLGQVFSSQRAFANPEDCSAYVRAVQGDRERIIAAQKLWCARNFNNLHDSQGCYDAAPAFLDNFTEEAFCRGGAPVMSDPAQFGAAQTGPGQAEPLGLGAPGAQRVKYFGVYIEGYTEQGQKFDSPKRGPMPGAQKSAVGAKAAPAPKPGTAVTPAVQPAPAGQVAAPAALPAQTSSGQPAAPASQVAPVQPATSQPASQGGSAVTTRQSAPASSAGQAGAPAPGLSTPAGSASGGTPGSSASGSSATGSPATGSFSGGTSVRQAIEPPSLSGGAAASPQPGVQAPAQAPAQSGGQPAAQAPAQSTAQTHAQPQIQPVQPPAQSAAQPAQAPAAPGEAAAEPAGPSGADPAAPLAPQPPEEIPAWPQAQDLPVSPAQQQPAQAPAAQSYLPGQQSLNATTGPNAVSPGAVPEGVRAALGEESFPQRAPVEAVMPVLPTPGYTPIEVTEPVIGQREEVRPLPPVPAIGRIAPQLMPGVPPDTAVMDNTLPPQEEPQQPPATQIPAANPVDAFSDIIPNFVPPPPPNPYDTTTVPMPVSGTPAGQAGS